MDNQTIATPVNWEAVRMLALTVGVRESARRMGLSEDRVRQRCTREGWLATPEARTLNKRALEERSGLTCRQLSPSAAFQGELNALGAKSRLSLARGIAKAGAHIETLDGAAILDKSSDVKSVAQTADLIHGWKDSAPQVKIRLDVLGAAQEGAIMEVESSVSPSAVWDNEDDLDSY